ncbi:ABC transporter permease [Seonamhaeicola sp. ML3]|uniref:ABC transporter permease n=1 Tax=Seonamhaeicola sp. ML3 TaxID=2937786 RepID=UPI00200C09E8|nr:ABC transporter permease [Seonamhaeicola sp. ML3]
MFDLDLWREIFQSINKNRTRSLLSGFTIAFAIMLFTILFGLANGLENTFMEFFGTDARNSIVVFPGRTTKAYKGFQSGRRIRFKNEDYDFILEEFGDDVEYITSKVNRNVEASFKGEKDSYQVRSVHPEHMYIENNIVEKGRYINNADLLNRTKVAVIGEAIDEDLFAGVESIGKYISLNGIPYKVVGVFSDDEGDNEEKVIYTPITTAQRIYGNNDYIDFIHLTYNPKLDYNQAIEFGNALTTKLKDKFGVARDDQRAIRVRNFAEGTKNVSQMMFVLNFIVLFIGLGTLIAGIMGISNIMVFIVKERTKELGVRKALGASPRSIVSIILLEAILITSLAGYIGLLIGATILSLVGPGLKTYFITNPSVETSVVVGATILLIISGVIAGYLPARKASRIKPIVALRNE